MLQAAGAAILFIGFLSNLHVLYVFFTEAAGCFADILNFNINRVALILSEHLLFLKCRFFKVFLCKMFLEYTANSFTFRNVYVLTAQLLFTELS